MNYPKEPKRKKLIQIAAICTVAVFSLVWIAADEVEFAPVYKPQYEQEDLSSILDETHSVGSFSKGGKSKEKIQFTEEEYQLLFEQTGLGPSAVDYLAKNEKDFEKAISRQQKIFFDGYPYTCVKIGLVTYNERMRDESGKKIKGRKLVDLRPGDVLISLSTHTLGYRHGHCGIVVEGPKKGKEAKTVEAVYWGEPTELQTTGKWRSCPTLLHLRISEEAARAKGYTQEELGEKLAEYAKSDGLDVQYSLLPGIHKKRTGTMKRTHCSHLIWYIYKHFGYDIDSDGGAVVTPYDIAADDLFEIVQVYGIDPNFGREQNDQNGRSD